MNNRNTRTLYWFETRRLARTHFNRIVLLRNSFPVFFVMVEEKTPGVFGDFSWFSLSSRTHPLVDSLCRPFRVHMGSCWTKHPTLEKSIVLLYLWWSLHSVFIVDPCIRLYEDERGWLYLQLWLRWVTVVLYKSGDN